MLAIAESFLTHVCCFQNLPPSLIISNLVVKRCGKEACVTTWEISHVVVVLQVPHLLHILWRVSLLLDPSITVSLSLTASQLTYHYLGWQSAVEYVSVCLRIACWHRYLHSQDEITSDSLSPFEKVTTIYNCKLPKEVNLFKYLGDYLPYCQARVKLYVHRYWVWSASVCSHNCGATERNWFNANPNSNTSGMFHM